jgi:hypothetical protein
MQIWICWIQSFCAFWIRLSVIIWTDPDPILFFSDLKNKENIKFFPNFLLIADCWKLGAVSLKTVGLKTDVNALKLW